MMRTGSKVRGEEAQAAVLTVTTAGAAAVTAGQRQWRRR